MDTMPLNIPPLEWPKIYNMVNLGGIDLATANGSAVPGIYQKITAALTSDHIEVFYNWKFADIVLPPSKVAIDVSVANQYIINEEILVKSDDTVGIIGFIRIPIIEPLTAEENKIYNIPIGIDGFGPVTVNVPAPPPVLVQLNATVNDVYTPPTGYDGFDRVIVNVPDIPPVTESLSITENGDYTPPSGVDGFSSVHVEVPPILPVTTELSVVDNGVYTPSEGVDGFSRVTVNVPQGPSFAPLHYDMNAGYLNSGSYYYGSGSISDVYQAISGHAYCIVLGTPVGNRFRCAFFDNDPYTFTTNVNGTIIGSDSSNPWAYAYKTVYTAPRNGYIMVMKSNASQTGCKSFCFDLTALSAQ